MNNLQIGTFGWQHADWLGTFYPEDLPQDWELDYYSNAFRVVLLPQAQWRQWGEEEIEDALDAVEGDFSFFLALSEPLSEVLASQIEVVKSHMGSKLGGVVVFAEDWLPDEWICGLPVSLVSSSQTLPGWRWQWANQVCSGAPFGFVADLPREGKEQAKMLQNFMQSLPENLLGAPFFIGGESINMAQVTDLKVIGEISGY
ncbi:hypothetical protein QCB44_01760 [Thiomicrorhabdus sp. zzn3]|uniref:hypothetical protein n=1 Tax=Thiomicrorhabdus sp. zzn3 TaxID=3039775 RepID=UPI0024365A38|nr:hypothetical protein [Thiomicrorhabdus sp. zzn3]MDG6777422.1 hypothetical protein [Thiomicrorhabdus sp. zzn3]